MTQPFDPPYEGATLEQIQNENVQHFLYTHNFLRNEMSLLLRLIDELTDEGIGGQNGETAEANQSTVQALVRSGSHYAQHLHNHHHGETSLLFPLLKMEGLSTEVINRLNREHDEIGQLIDRVSATLFRMKTAGLSKINDDLRELGDALRQHLDFEETHVCPLLTTWASTAKFYAAVITGSRS